MIEQPRDPGLFVEHLRSKMATALTNLDIGLPANVKVKIVTTKNGKAGSEGTSGEQSPEATQPRLLPPLLAGEAGALAAARIIV